MDAPLFHPILSCKAAASYEHELFAADPSLATCAMHTAGKTIGKALLEDAQYLHPQAKAPHMLVLCHKGFNTGDALIAAQTFIQARPDTQLSLLFACEQDELKPAVKDVLENLSPQKTLWAPNAPADIFEKHFSDHPIDICIDGLFGMSFKPPLSPETEALIQSVNTHPHIRMRCAIDLPSGLGDQSAKTRFRADFTYAPGILKAPCINATTDTGRLRYLDIGFFKKASTTPPSDRVCPTPQILEPLRTLRPAESDKRTYGRLLIIAGSLNMPGAMLMAARSALKAGIGLLTIACPQSLCPHLASSIPEAMWLPLPENDKGELAPGAVVRARQHLDNSDAVLIGPGIGPNSECAVLNFLQNCKAPIVLDASALTAKTIPLLQDRKDCIITPHIGELERLTKNKKLSQSEIPAWLDTVHFTGALLLKGPNTHIFCHNHTISVIPHAGPLLARGGTGDILSGLCATLLAQNPQNPYLVANQAAYWHADAAHRLAQAHGERTVHTTELLSFL